MATLYLGYNGEIYNYREIRQELQRLGHTFQSDSDTEVILHAYEAWSQACVDRFIGMFAFALFVEAVIKLFQNQQLRYNDMIWRLLTFQMWYQKWSVSQ